MRTKTNQDKQVKAFIESGEKEAIIYMVPNKPLQRLLKSTNAL